MNTLAGIEGVTLDAAGTLLFPDPSVGVVYMEVMGAFGLHLNPNDLENGFRAAIGKVRKDPQIRTSESREREYWRSIVAETIRGLADLPERFDKLFEALWLEFAKGARWRLNTDAIAVFEMLEDRGIPFALLTNWDSRVRDVLHDHRIHSRFSQVFISSEVGFEKPDRQLFEYVANAMALHPRELLHVGDSWESDYLGAVNSGWNALHLSSSPGSTGISRLGDLQALI